MDSESTQVAANPGPGHAEIRTPTTARAARRGPLINALSWHRHEARGRTSSTTRWRVARSWGGPVSWVVVIVSAVVVIVLVRMFALDWHPVTSDSMAPTVERGDIVVVDKLSRHLDDVGRGDLVTFASPVDGKPVAKRVVAVAGDTVAIDDAVLVVNGLRVSEPYVDHDRIDGTFFGPVTVPGGHLFVLGDNRFGSVDSRVYGPISSATVTGRILWVLR